MRVFVCYFHEILLKGKNRPFFERILTHNVERALRGLRHGRVRRASGRILVELRPDSPLEEIGERLTRIFGMVYCCPAWSSSQNIEILQEDLWELVKDRDFETFKIEARRASKKYPIGSQELNQRLGAVIQQRCGRPVRLKEPELTCYVDIVEDFAFLYFDRLRGARGLPLSSSGRVAVLLSGGIDSPVAAYKVMKRGCRAVFVHFHSLPDTSPESVEKVRTLVSILDRYQHGSRLYMIPFAGLQRKIVAFAPLQLRVILYRRFMMRLTQKVALRERAKALVTGESIGQVASQTLENLAVISECCRLPILRPLVGDDKEEIITTARQIGTFETSILPHQDCCSLFVPRHPETRARLEAVQKAEEALDIEEMLKEALGGLEIEKIGYSHQPQPEALSL